MGLCSHGHGHGHGHGPGHGHGHKLETVAQFYRVIFLASPPNPYLTNSQAL